MEREEAGETVNPKYELAEAGTDRVQKLGSKLVTEPLVAIGFPGSSPFSGPLSL